MNIEIPSPSPAYDEDALVEKAVKEVLADLERGSHERKFAQINTCNCATGGYPMPVIRRVGKAFASKGWFVYLVTGGAYHQPSWMDIQNYEGFEGYSSARIPSYYERIR